MKNIRKKKLTKIFILIYIFRNRYSSTSFEAVKRFCPGAWLSKLEGRNKKKCDYEFEISSWKQKIIQEWNSCGRASNAGGDQESSWAVISQLGVVSK